jgi:hypothetical protein
MADKQIIRVTTPLLNGTTTSDIIGGQAESFSAVSGGVLYVPAGLVVTVEITHDVIDPTAAAPVWLNSVTVTGSDEHVISSPCTALRVTRVSGSGVVRGELLLGAAGAAGTTDNPSVVRLADAIEGENEVLHRMMTAPAFNFTRTTTATTTLVKTGEGIMSGIFVEVVLAGTVTVYDSLTASGSNPLVLPVGTVAGFHPFPLKFSVGLTVVTSNTDKISVGFI